METMKFKEILKKRNLKATQNRLGLLEAISAFKTAMPYSELQKTLNYMDRVTLYRTIDKLKEQGVIHKAFQENNETFYAICGEKCSSDTHHHDHIHFKCIKCKAVTCENMDKALKISLPDYEIHKVAINVSGVCGGCLV
ncbi:MAG: Fur family transcriptional regulator [Chitinophagales bacterium]